MVLIIPLLQRKIDILNEGKIDALFYYALMNMTSGRFDRTAFTGHALVAYDGFIGNPVSQEEIGKIISKPAIRGIDYSNNIYNFIGIHLAAKNKNNNELDSRFESFDTKNKFAVSLFFPEYAKQLGELVKRKTDAFSKLLNLYYNSDVLADKDSISIAEFGMNSNSDIIEIILYELLFQKFTQFKYTTLTSVGLVKQILNNFQDAIKKITTERRKGKTQFVFEDEYDVQDVAYLLFKGIFHDMQYENPFLKKAGHSSIIDLMSEREKLAIEIKMMLPKYTEKKILEQLKIDIINYSSWNELKNLVIFVYDPNKIISDRNNFYSLNGEHIHNGVKFNVDVIISN